jgi:nucleotide-binding universal stress UspA family protein
MKKVLIAIDYNSSAKKVAESGYAFAKLMNAEISIVHAISDISHYAMEYSPTMGFERFNSDGPYMNIEEQTNEAYNYLECVVQHLNDKNITTCVLDGRTSKTILEYAISWKADLIVMGTQNHSGFEKLCPGNVTSIILKRSDIPVLVIPSEKYEPKIVTHNRYAYLQI